MTAPADHLVSADSHVAISHDAVKSNLQSSLHAEYDEAVAEFQRRTLASIGGMANRAMRNFNPAAGRPGYSNPDERLKDMDEDGVSVEVLYSEVSGFRYLYLLKDGGTAATRAFNDTMHQFGSADPDRLIVSYQIPIHDIGFAVKEVQRVANLGGKSLQLPCYPSELGLPEYYEDTYDRLWGAISEAGLPICCHIGLNTNLDALGRRDPTPQRGVMVPMTALSTAEAFGMWILGGTLERFPMLKLVFVEPGLGWVPWYLSTIDDMATRQGYEFDRISELPSYYFYRNIFLTFIDEVESVQLLRHRLGVQNIMWSTDYPHPVTTWPNSRALVEEQMKGIPDDERDLMVSGNARRVWNLN